VLTRQRGYAGGELAPSDVTRQFPGGKHRLRGVGQPRNVLARKAFQGVIAERHTYLCDSGLSCKRLQPVDGALHASPSPIQHVGVDHRDLDTPVAQELLDRADVVAVHQEVGRKGVTEGVAGGQLTRPAARAASWKACWTQRS
jgi:hypothetical protein